VPVKNALRIPQGSLGFQLYLAKQQTVMRGIPEPAKLVEFTSAALIHR
jgi:hypothetical protein